jgi:hypothetical protein
MNQEESTKFIAWAKIECRTTAQEVLEKKHEIRSREVPCCFTFTAISNIKDLASQISGIRVKEVDTHIWRC